MSKQSKKSQIKIGDIFSAITIVEVKTSEFRKVLGKCSCGTTRFFDYVSLLNGRIKSCGCKKAEFAASTNMTKYGTTNFNQSTQGREGIKAFWNTYKDTEAYKLREQKREKTLKEKYGDIRSTSQLPEVRQKQLEVYF
jgi:hypothetical protein